MKNTTNEKIYSQKAAHIAILKYIGILSVLTVIGFKVAGSFLDNYMKDVGSSPVNSTTVLTSDEMIKVQTRPEAKAGEIGYEFKISRPMVVIHNYIPGGDRGYGTEIKLVNSVSRKIVEPTLKNIETSEKKNFKDRLPMTEELNLNNSFIVVNRIDVDGRLSSFHLFVLRDQNGQEYLISQHLVPWNQ